MKVYTEERQRLLYLRGLATGTIQGPPTGYASKDMPWLSNYPEQILGLPTPEMKLEDYLNQHIRNENIAIMHYYGSDITWKDIKNHSMEVAKALQSLGVKSGDSIMVDLESVPEFFYLLLAAEKLGANIKPREAKSDSKVAIVKDYLSDEEIEELYSRGVSQVVTVSPYQSADLSKMRENILTSMQQLYTYKSKKNMDTISWKNFLTSGKDQEITPIPYQKNKLLLTACTSGSISEPKEVKHTSESMLGVVDQLVVSSPPMPEGAQLPTWLLSILPPSLVAVVVAMMLFPLASNKKLILDPYCDVKDIDLEIMHYQPNCWASIPYFFEQLLKSKRIPENYDMSHLQLVGFGAEPMREKFLKKGLEFLQRHNCHAPFGSGYGQSEGGSDNTISLWAGTFLPGSAGIPLVRTVMGIFEKGTEKELSYNQIGEVCKSGPGLMQGYGDQESTENALKYHEDGKLWLHTGDVGFITPEGMLFVLGRSEISRFPHKQSDELEQKNKVYALEIENKVLELPQVSDAVVVATPDVEHPGYEVPHLFVVMEDGVTLGGNQIDELHTCLASVLTEYEMPQDVHPIDEKPISHFKTNRRMLEKTLQMK